MISPWVPCLGDLNARGERTGHPQGVPLRLVILPLWTRPALCAANGAYGVCTQLTEVVLEQGEVAKADSGVAVVIGPVVVPWVRGQRAEGLLQHVEVREANGVAAVTVSC